MEKVIQRFLVLTFLHFNLATKLKHFIILLPFCFPFFENFLCFLDLVAIVVERTWVWILISLSFFSWNTRIVAFTDFLFNFFDLFYGFLRCNWIFFFELNFHKICHQKCVPKWFSFCDCISKSCTETKILLRKFFCSKFCHFLFFIKKIRAPSFIQDVQVCNRRVHFWPDQFVNTMVEFVQSSVKLQSQLQLGYGIG